MKLALGSDQLERAKARAEFPLGESTLAQPMVRLPACCARLSLMHPETRYARSGDVAIAYQIVGTGPPDLVFVRGITGDLLSTWEQPLLVRHVEGLAEFGRVLMLDKRGTRA